MRRLPVLCLAVATLALPGFDCLKAPPDTGFVSEAWVQARNLEFLQFATTDCGNSPNNAIAHMERSLVDPEYDPLDSCPAVDVGAWENAAGEGTFGKIDKLLDTRDFGGLYILTAYLAYGPTDADPLGHPYLTPAMWAQIKDSMLKFKMWFTDATPAVPDPTDPDCVGGLGPPDCRDWDESFYWTENHRILYHVIEYLAGQRWPDECFVVTRFTPTGTCDGVDAFGRGYEYLGSELRERARPKMLEWLDERWAIGFAEWHSNIYYQKDATPLLAMVEWIQEDTPEDSEITRKAAIMLDVLMMDLALHGHQDTLGVTHGRSAMKDKWRGPRNDTWGIYHLMFQQQTAIGYESTGDSGASHFSRAKKYRLPQAIWDVAHSDRTFVDRERHSIWIDEGAPLPNGGAHFGDADYTPDEPPGYPIGLGPADLTPDIFTFWWSLGAWTIWQVVPATITYGDEFNLWNASLLSDFKLLRDIIDRPAQIDTIAAGQDLASAIFPLGAVGLLKEANTYLYRTPDYVLSTAQDYRKGMNSGQVHAWQATIDPETLVFTTHPMNDVQPPAEWIGSDEGEPGYWTGTASMPRSAQHENVGIHLYAPLYAGGLFGFFQYQQKTHAYFPQERFDEVVEHLEPVDRGGESPVDELHWIFGRKGDVYLALWSWRALRWQDYSADELAVPGFTLTETFDLVADGLEPPDVSLPSGLPRGSENVWIVEMGTAEEWGTFADFRSAILAADPQVDTTADFFLAAPGFGNAFTDFDVTYDSPSQGLMTFGWDAPFSVAGEEIPLGPYPRFANPWLQLERGAPEGAMASGPYLVYWDWDEAKRFVSEVSAP